MSEARKASLFGSFRLSGKKDKQAEDFVLSSPTNPRRDSTDVTGDKTRVSVRFFDEHAGSDSLRSPSSPARRASSAENTEAGAMKLFFSPFVLRVQRLRGCFRRGESAPASSS
jgi:hypothetical protein